MRIILADDNKTFREALVMFLTQELNHTVVGEYENGLDLLYDTSLRKVDLLILDIEMPKLNGLKTMDEINKKFSWIKAIAITDYSQKAYLTDLITHGFKGCVFKDCLYKDLEHTISIVANGGISFPRNMSI